MEVPEDVLNYIYLYLDIKDIVVLCTTKKHIDLCNDKSFWTRKFLYDKLPILGKPSMKEYIKLNILTKKAINITNTIYKEGDVIFITHNTLINGTLINQSKNIKEMEFNPQNNHLTIIYNDNNYIAIEINKNQLITMLITILYHYPNINIIDGIEYSFINKILAEQLKNENNDININTRKMLDKRLKRLQK